MPQYRFRWENIDPGLLRAFVDPEVADADVVGVLRATFGARPKHPFVAELWPLLRDDWLSADPSRRERVVQRLRDAGLGRAGIDVTGADGQMAYLASCRNSATLRTVVLDEFIAMGEARSGTAGAAVVKPAPAPSSLPEVDQAAAGPALSEPQNPDELRAAIVATLQRLLHVDEVVVDDDGDIPIRWGSAVVFVRVLDELPVIRCFSFVLSGVPVTVALRDAVNEVNQTHILAHAYWVDDTVVVSADCFASPYSQAAFVNVLNAVAETADTLDDDLAARFGATAPPGSAAGYL